MQVVSRRASPAARSQRRAWKEPALEPGGQMPVARALAGKVPTHSLP